VVRRASLVSIGVILVGFAFYALGIVSTFTVFRLKPTTPELFSVFGATAAAGLGALILGYGWIVIIGGRYSLRIAMLYTRITSSKHTVNVKPDDTNANKGILVRMYLVFVSAMIFLLLISMAWDLYNVDGPDALFLHPLIHALDLFSKPGRINPLVYSAERLPALLILLAIVGVVPCLALPYLRRFKITSINSAPFHVMLLTTFFGFFVGISAGVALVGLVYRVLWAGQSPVFYHFVILVGAGLSTQFALGTYLGRARSERLVEERLKRHVEADGIFVGQVIVQQQNLSEAIEVN